MPKGKSPGPSIKHPGAYEKLKSSLMRRGMSEDAAQTKAARLTNAGYGIKGGKGGKKRGKK